MRLERARPADRLTGAAGLALLVLLFLPWYELPEGGVSAFEQFTVVDLWLALTALLAIAVPVVTAARDSPAVPVTVTVVAHAVSWIAVLLAIWRVLDTPGEPLDPTPVPFLGLLATLAVCAATFWAMRDERAPGLRPPPPVQTMPGPPRRTDTGTTADAT